MRSLDFTTDCVRPQERYDAWRGRPWPSYAHILRTERSPGEFYSHSRTFNLGILEFSDTRMAGQGYVRTTSMIRSDGFDVVTLALVLEGRFHGETPATSFRGAAGSVLIGDMSVPFDQSFTNARVISLSFHRGTVEKLVPRIGTLHGLVLSGRDAEPLVHQVLQDLEQLSSLEDAAGTTLGERLTGTFLSCLGQSELCTLSADAAKRRLKTEICWILEQRYREADLDIDKIASLAGVSRATLYRAFGGSTGIAAALHNLRLRKAAAALQDPQDRRLISEIAYSVGIPRSDTFNKVFRAAYDCSPREWRHRAVSTPARQD
ncbi:AraC family transcriptional regulator [Aureimonas ureilytica]|uniref:AraC family transcriptional regulator n=1 Tax=Aureimonas ureilytica TaxID=401562 RepID=UPI00036F5998|nr:AraC family transcriptional regulator [Aureimonas ureilytica]